MKFKFIKIKADEFENSFSTSEQCLEYLANQKWENGYICKKCGNTNSCNGKTLFSRRCTKCKHDESATANTMFHGCKIPLIEAFKLAYNVCNSPEISIAKLSETIDRRQMTCWKLKKKIMECMKENQKATS